MPRWELRGQDFLMFLDFRGLQYQTSEGDFLLDLMLTKSSRTLPTHR